MEILNDNFTLVGLKINNFTGNLVMRPRSHGRQAAKIDVVDLAEREIVTERSWDLFELMYEREGGLLGVGNFKKLAEEADYIKAAYAGKLSSIKDFEIEKCCALMLFKWKFGLKVFSGAGNIVCFSAMEVRSGFSSLMKWAMKHGWGEFSGGTEKFAKKFGHQIPAECIAKIYPNSKVIPCGKDENDEHYKRVINGTTIKKIAYGSDDIVRKFKTMFDVED